MMAWSDHLMIVPVVLPLVAAAVMLLIEERRQNLKAAINIASILLVAGAAIALLHSADAQPAGAGSAHVGVYRLGDWPAPFGIVLVVDRLSALMLTLSSVLALSAAVFSLARWHRAGPHFHSLFQLLLMGINGALLTGDLFNLFVFFELLLAASYGLVLHGSGIARVKAGLHYVAVNLAASLLFLIGVSLIYSVTGTLNMADLSARISQIPAEDRMLLEAGAAVLGTAFLVKAGMWPLSFWLPTAYSVAAPPVAAIFAILSKVGVYVILRLWLLFFGPESGASAGFGGQWLLFSGMATIAFGAIGALASQNMVRLASYSVLVSSGTLIAIIAAGHSVATGAALFYLVSSTLAISAFFMLTELVERGHEGGGDMLAVTREAYGEDDDSSSDEEEVGVAIPATAALLGLCFMGCALVLAGLPPLSGFIAKFAVLTALFEPMTSGPDAGVPGVTWALLGFLILSGLMTLIAMIRAGIRTFWTPQEWTVPRVRVIEMMPVAVLLLACAMLTIQAEPAMRYMQAAAASLYAPEDYIRNVLTAPVASDPRGENGS
jgi:multicomponent K+:H+ antiporter subunit D